MGSRKSTISSLHLLRTKLSPPMRYALAFAIFLCAVALRILMFPVDGGFPYLTFYPAAVIALYTCGIGPGVLCIALCAFIAYWVFTPPAFTLALDYDGIVSVSVFLFSSCLIGALVREKEQFGALLRSVALQLSQSEQRYKRLLEDQTETLCRYKADGTILYVNGAFCRTFGNRPEDWVGKAWHPVAWHEDIGLIEEQLKSLSAAKPVVTIENRVVTMDKGISWRQFVNRAFFDADGNIQEIQSVGRDIDERKRLDQELAAATRTFQDLYDHAPCGYHSIDANGIFVNINQTELDWLGCTREEVIGKKSPLDFYTPECRQSFEKNYSKFRIDGHIENLEYDLQGKDGKIRRVSISGSSVMDAKGNFLMSRSVMYDITELQEIRKKLELLLGQQEAMIDNDLIGIVKLKDREIVWFNRGFSLLLGYEMADLAGMSTRVFYPDEASFAALGRTAYPVVNSNGIYRTQCKLIRKDRTPIWVDMSGFLLSPADGISMWVLADFTQMKMREEKFEHAAGHDWLTDLPNRLVLSDQIRQAVARARRLERMLAVCYLDLDDFKPINDRFGHEAGDRVLREVARRLKGAIRASDFLCRLGGDEFLLLLTDVESMAECESAIRRIHEDLGETYALGDGQEACVTLSVGVTLTASGEMEPDALLRQADQAMYEAKNLGGNRIFFYGQTLPEGASLALSQ